MELPDLKKLKALIALCRKSGVDTIEVGDMKITLLPLEPKAQRKPRVKAQSANSVSAESTNDSFESDTPSAEDLLFWSVGSDPEASQAVE